MGERPVLKSHRNAIPHDTQSLCEYGFEMYKRKAKERKRRKKKKKTKQSSKRQERHGKRLCLLLSRPPHVVFHKIQLFDMFGFTDLFFLYPPQTVRRPPSS